MARPPDNQIPTYDPAIFIEIDLLEEALRKIEDEVEGHWALLVDAQQPWPVEQPVEQSIEIFRRQLWGPCGVEGCKLHFEKRAGLNMHRRWHRSKLAEKAA